MPIYEYQCTACGELTEALQKMSDPPLTDCPACGESALRKKVSAAAFRLKGGGWYETDFKSSNKKNLAGDGEAGGKDAGTKDAAGKDGKDSKGSQDSKASGDSKPAAKESGSGSKEAAKPAKPPAAPKSDR